MRLIAHFALRKTQYSQISLLKSVFYVKLYYTQRGEDRLTTQKYHKVRLSVDCTEEERKYIKMRAASCGLTISEYLLSFARAEMPKRTRRQARVPNKRTERALREAREGTEETYESIDEFWEAMGIDSNED